MRVEKVLVQVILFVSSNYAIIMYLCSYSKTNCIYVIKTQLDSII